MDNQDATTQELEAHVLNINNICRLCAGQNEKLISIFGEEGIAHDLSTKINLYLPIKVLETDELPLMCCWECATTIITWDELVLATAETDRKFRSCQFIPDPDKTLVKGMIFDMGSSAVTIGEHTGGLKDEDFADDFRETGQLISEDDDSKESEDTKTKVQQDPSADVSAPEKLKKLQRISPAKQFDEVADLTNKLCKLCSLDFTNRTALKKHVKEKHDIIEKRFRRKNAEIVTCFYCEVCKKGFTRKYDMQKHRKHTHQDIPVPLLPATNRQKNSAVLSKCKVLEESRYYYKCDFCKKIFNQSYNLLRHRTMHTGDRAFFCHICAKRFQNSNGLSRHVSQYHNKERKHKCDVCNKCFMTKANRDEHLNIHTNNRPFVCDVCGKCFKQKASLHVHKIFHSNVFKFSCNICDKKFRRTQDLKVHSWLHSGHKPHSCQTCGASFRLGQDLKRHRKIHDKPNNECTCLDCGAVFSQQKYLKVHSKIHIHLVVRPVPSKACEVPVKNGTNS